MNIIKINDNEYLVNSKTAYKDLEGKWMSEQPFTPEEKKSFFKHLENL